MLDGPVPDVKKLIVSVDSQVECINAAKGSMFMPIIEY